jgi:hypothetical protein
MNDVGAPPRQPRFAANPEESESIAARAGAESEAASHSRLDIMALLPLNDSLFEFSKSYHQSNKRVRKVYEEQAQNGCRPRFRFAHNAATRLCTRRATEEPRSVFVGWWRASAPFALLKTHDG